MGENVTYFCPVAQVSNNQLQCLPTAFGLLTNLTALYVRRATLETTGLILTPNVLAGQQQ